MVWFKRVNSELLHRETREQHTVVVYHEVTLVAIGHISVYLVNVAVRSDLIAELQRTSPRHLVEKGLNKVVDDIFLSGADVEGEVSHRCLRDRCMTFLNKKTMATSEKTPAGWN